MLLPRDKHNTSVRLAVASSARRALLRALGWGSRLAIKDKPTKPNQTDKQPAYTGRHAKRLANHFSHVRFVLSKNGAEAHFRKRPQQNSACCACRGGGVWFWRREDGNKQEADEDPSGELVPHPPAVFVGPS